MCLLVSVDIQSGAPGTYSSFPVALFCWGMNLRISFGLVPVVLCGSGLLGLVGGMLSVASLEDWILNVVWVVTRQGEYHQIFLMKQAFSRQGLPREL